MKLSDLFAEKTPTLSFEVFPPKTSETYDSVAEAALEIAHLQPHFMSVTYGAGGSTDKFTAAIAADVLASDVTPLAHLSCIGATRESIIAQLNDLRLKGVQNILALRGDLPSTEEKANTFDYTYASELVAEIKNYGGFCVGGACYPEGHTESATQQEDIRHLKEKVDAGCDFLTTQMFFDNNILYNFLYKVRDTGINVPIVAGIMPVTNAKQIKRIVELSGTRLPQRFHAIIDRFGDDPEAMKQAGIIYATEQIIDLLANGVNYIHVYSMNKPEVAAAIKANLSQIIPG